MPNTPSDEWIAAKIMTQSVLRLRSPEDTEPISGHKDEIKFTVPFLVTKKIEDLVRKTFTDLHVRVHGDFKIDEERYSTEITVSGSDVQEQQPEMQLHAIRSDVHSLSAFKEKECPEIPPLHIEQAKIELKNAFRFAARGATHPDPVYNFSSIALDETRYKIPKVNYIAVNRQNMTLAKAIISYLQQEGMSIEGFTGHIGGFIQDVKENKDGTFRSVPSSQMNDEIRPEQAYACLTELSKASRKNSHDFVYYDKIKEYPIMLFLTQASFMDLKKTLENTRDQTP